MFSDPSLFIPEPRQFPDRHPVRHGNGHPADERFQRLCADGSVEVQAADRVGPVQDHERYPLFCRRLHHQRYRGNEGVESRADVLDIAHQHVDPFKHRAGRLMDLSIEGKDRDPEIGVGDMVDDLSIRRIACDSMFRPVQRLDRAEPRFRHGVDEKAPVGQSPRMVGEDADAFVPDELRGVGQKSVGPRPDNGCLFRDRCILHIRP